MNDDDTERCAAAAVQLGERLETLSREVDRAALFEHPPDLEQLRRWAAALDRCMDAATRISGIIDDAIAARPLATAPAKVPAEPLANATRCV
jgi:hypothetical protein